MGKRELIVLLNLSSWCLVMVERLFLAVPQGCLQFVIVVFPDHTHLLFCYYPIGILGQVWYLIVLIPDMSPLSYLIVRGTHYISAGQRGLSGEGEGSHHNKPEKGFKISVVKVIYVCLERGW